MQLEQVQSPHRARAALEADRREQRSPSQGETLETQCPQVMPVIRKSWVAAPGVVAATADEASDADDDDDAPHMHPPPPQHPPPEVEPEALASEPLAPEALASVRPRLVKELLMVVPFCWCRSDSSVGVVTTV